MSAIIRFATIEIEMENLIVLPGVGTLRERVVVRGDFCLRRQALVVKVNASANRFACSPGSQNRRKPQTHHVTRRDQILTAHAALPHSIMIEEELDEDFLNMLREAFAIEAAELVQSMTAGLQELGQMPAPERRLEIVTKIHRDAHSLKGAAAAVSRSDIESVSKALEAIFAQWKTSAVTVTPENSDQLNRATHLLSNLLQPSATDSADLTKVAQIVQELAAVADSSIR